MLREQNVGASALLGREVVAWHSLAADPDDVVLQTRPDVIFKVRVRVRVRVSPTPNPNPNTNPT